MTDASSLSGIIAGMLTLSPVWAGAGHAGVCGRAADSLLLSSSPPPLRLWLRWLWPFPGWGPLWLRPHLWQLMQLSPDPLTHTSPDLTPHSLPSHRTSWESVCRHCVCGQQQTRAKIWENIPERRIEWHLVVCVLNPKSQRIQAKQRVRDLSSFEPRNKSCLIHLFVCLWHTTRWNVNI